MDGMTVLSATLRTNQVGSAFITWFSSIGVPKNLEGTIFPFEYNNIDYLEMLIKNNDIGIIKMEVARNIKPKNNFLQDVRTLADKNNIVLVFDECTTGFRETFGGYHKKFNVNPDIVILSKALEMDMLYLQ